MTQIQADNLNIVDLEFENQTDLIHGKYSFSFDTLDKHGARAKDYSGHIILAPKNSREPDEFEWDDNCPDNWEDVEDLGEKLSDFIFKENT